MGVRRRMERKAATVRLDRVSCRGDNVRQRQRAAYFVAVKVNHVLVTAKLDPSLVPPADVLRPLLQKAFLDALATHETAISIHSYICIAFRKSN